VSQDRLRKALVAAVEAAVASPDWQEGDQLCVILADGESTVLSTRGFFGTTAALAELLEFHVGKLWQVPET
jgi:hypothetical protein